MISKLGLHYLELRESNRVKNQNAISLRQYEIFCAWCKIIIGYGQVQNSHGICSKCEKKWLDRRFNR